MIRRVVAAALVAATLSACALLQHATGPAGLARAAADVELIAKGLGTVVPQLGQIVGLDAATIAKIKAAVDDIDKVATAIADAQTTTAAQPLVVEIEDDLNVVTGALAGLKLPGKAGEVIAAAEVLLPIVEVAVDLAVPAKAVRAAAATTPQQARRVLAEAAR